MSTCAVCWTNLRLVVPDRSVPWPWVPSSIAGDADRAEQLLLASSRPSAAIELRRELGHWERAVELAEHLEPHALGGLALLRAQAMEAEGQVGGGPVCGWVGCGLAERVRHAEVNTGSRRQCPVSLIGQAACMTLFPTMPH